MHIRPLAPDDVEAAAAILVAAFREHWPASWATMEEAREEVGEALEEERVALGALDEAGRLLGWIGGMPSYARVWELHPLAVHPDAQGRGVGRALLAAWETAVRERGALTVMLGSDDEDDMTSLAGLDLYDDLPGHIARLSNLRRHPFEFYQKCGYTVVGLVPDANGLGKPDILMAKRVGEA